MEKTNRLLFYFIYSFMTSFQIVSLIFNMLSLCLSCLIQSCMRQTVLTCQTNQVSTFFCHIKVIKLTKPKSTKLK